MRFALVSSLILLCACGSSTAGLQGDDGANGAGSDLNSDSKKKKDAGTTADAGTAADAGTIVTSGAPLQRIAIVMMENHDASEIYGAAAAPYLNGLMQANAYATHFVDVVPLAVPSEPHYVWLEAGTNVFSDHTFTTDSDASASNSTASTAHLTTLLDKHGVSWMTYQENLSGSCPMSSSTPYAAKHDPFVFFQDVTSGATCAAHHKDASTLAADIAAGTLATYVLVTPNLCHDMHGDASCASGSTVSAGDAWLQTNLPALIAWEEANHGAVFVVWDEGDKTLDPPFILVSNQLVSTGFANDTVLSMTSLTHSLQDILGVSPAQGESYLGHAADLATNDLSSFFAPGVYP